MAAAFEMMLRRACSSMVMPQESKPGGEVILFQTEGAQTRLQVRLDGQTAWLTRAQMAELFQTTVPNINLHPKKLRGRRIERRSNY
jgi:hypothetical protein